MAEHDVQSRVATIETEMKQVFNVLEQLSKQFETLQASITFATPAQVEVLLPQQPTIDPKNRSKGITVSAPSTANNEMPDLIDDPPQVTINNPTFVTHSVVPKTEEGKCFAKIEEKLRQLQGLQDQAPTGSSHYAKGKEPKQFKMLNFDEYDAARVQRSIWRFIW